ncbi:MAG: DUF1365 domain-containing protein [Cyanobacteria bacterium SZAS LIN-2]|nr:DUF1365 domain-containing protein [Cyanobacteria bacterium SZAS LIN-2]MBS2006474.1 DUF1365 domain-containing protein [Cyanobacteria bacterium SZAS TMP-1]
MAMPFNTRLYLCRVIHERLVPRHHRFSYGIYMLYFDLDELPALDRTCRFFSVDKPNLVSFYQADHLKDFSAICPEAEGRSLSERLRALLRGQGLSGDFEKAYLLTMPRILGYVFNPVSFYFVFGQNKTPVACVVEVGNTFNEMKTYLVKDARLAGDGFFRLCVPKHFYVSPFGKLADLFDFILPVPDEQLRICINTVRGDEHAKILTSSLSGTAKPFSEGLLLSCFCRYPLLTMKVIGMIHFQALLLWLKKIPFYRKEEEPHLQTDVLNAHASLKKRKIHV